MKRKTVNLEKLNELSLEDLQHVLYTVLAHAYNRSEEDLSKDIMAGLTNWEANERRRRDALKQALALVKAMPKRGGWATVQGLHLDYDDPRTNGNEA